MPRKTDYQYGYEAGQADARTAAFLAGTLDQREIDQLTALSQALEEPHAATIKASQFRRLMNTVTELQRDRS